MALQVRRFSGEEERAVHGLRERFAGVPTDAGEITIGDRWNLSEDGKTLILERTWSGPSGNTAQKIVHEKQP